MNRRWLLMSSCWRLMPGETAEVTFTMEMPGHVADPGDDYELVVHIPG